MNNTLMNILALSSLIGQPWECMRHSLRKPHFPTHDKGSTAISLFTGARQSIRAGFIKTQITLHILEDRLQVEIWINHVQ